jgi:hypothetical protein
MTLGSERRLQASSGENLCIGVAYTGTTGGEADLVFIFLLLLLPLIWLQHVIQSKAMMQASLSRFMVATQQVGENMTWGLFIKDG